MKLRPIGDRVVVKPQEADSKTPGGLIIPDAAKERPVRGEVMAVGTGRLLPDGQVRPLDVKTGDVVLYGKYAGAEVKVEGETYWILREEDILGIVI